MAMKAWHIITRNEQDEIIQDKLIITGQAFTAASRGIGWRNTVNKGEKINVQITCIEKGRNFSNVYQKIEGEKLQQRFPGHAGNWDLSSPNE